MDNLVIYSLNLYTITTVHFIRDVCMALGVKTQTKPSAESIKNVIEDVAKFLPMDSTDFAGRIEEFLRFRNICREVEFWFDEYATTKAKKVFKEVPINVEVYDSIDEVVCDGKRFYIYATMKMYVVYDKSIYIIDSYKVHKVEEKEE